MSKDLLQEVPSQRVLILLETLKKDPDRYYPLTQYLTIYKEYKDRKIDEPTQTLFTCGSTEDGVYVMETIFSNKGNPYTNLFIYTASKDLSNVRSVLSLTGRIRWWERGYSIQVVFKNIAPVIREVAKGKGIDLKWTESFMMKLPNGVSVSEGNIPEDMVLKHLSNIHVQQVSENWPHRFPGCEFYLEQQIRNNFGLGLFSKTDDKMVSSALSFHSGGIFVLFTDQNFRGRGYAEIIVRNMTKESLQRGRTPFAIVHKENMPSQKLFQKVGFEVFVEIEHLFPENFR